MKIKGLILFGLGALSMIPVVVYARHRRRLEAGGVMEPQSEIFQPSYGAVVDADIEELVPARG